MRQLTFLFFVGFLITLSSCRTDFETLASSGDLKFSKDTIYLDTVFTDIGSSTYTLKVYNQSKNDITIPTIQLKKGLNSKYRMTIDGMHGEQGKIFNNVNLLSKDSLYIFIETTANIKDANPTDFLYTDQIQFDGGTNLQKVELVTLIQDAVFLYPQRFNDGSTESITIGDDKLHGFYLDKNDPVHGNELHFTKPKSYVIYGYAAVPENETVIFDPGTRVHFHANSGLIISAGSSIKINGTASTTELLENEVIFEGDRLEPDFSDVPGQWDSVRLLGNNTASVINHLTLKNASIGLDIENNISNTITIKNSQIYDCVEFGILSNNSKIDGENIVINSAGLAGLSCTYGGNYKFSHCTFNNNWNSSSQNAVSINNYAFGAVPEVKDLTQATFNNCIIYGNYSTALFLSKKEGALYNYQFNNCIIKYYGSTTNPLYQFETDPAHYNAILLNKDPKYLNPNLNQFDIDETSPAIAKGNSAYLVPLDIKGITRTTPPDLGAYQNKPFPKKK